MGRHFSIFTAARCVNRVWRFSHCLQKRVTTPILETSFAKTRILQLLCAFAWMHTDSGLYIYTVLYSIYIFRTAWTTEYLERTPGSRGPMLMRRRYNYWELKWIWKVENTSIVKIGMQIGECLASVDVQRIFWRLLRISWLGMVYDCVKCRVKAKCIAAKQTQERLPLWHIYICLLWGDPRRS